MEKKFNHSVPKFYLRNFSNNTKSIGMYLLSHNQYVKDASIKDIAGQDYLYGKDSQIEDWFANLENEWAILIKDIINSEIISKEPEDYANLLMFIYLSEARTIQAAADLNNEIDTIYKAIAKMTYYNNNKITKDELDYYIKNTKVSADSPILPFIKGTSEMVCIMSDLNPVLIKNNSNIQFITSDCPVIRYNQMFIQRNYKKKYGWGNFGVQCFLPLSPRLCLCLFDQAIYKCKTKNDIIEINGADQINNLNKLFLYNANNSIYFNNSERDWVIERLVKTKKRHYNSKTNIHWGKNNKDFLLNYSQKSICEKINLNFFTVREECLKIPFPENEAGPLRPNAIEVKKSFRDKNKH